MRLQSQTAVLSGGEKYSVDQFALTDIRSVLKDQQDGIQVCVLSNMGCTMYIDSGTGCLCERRSCRPGHDGGRSPRRLHQGGGCLTVDGRKILKYIKPQESRCSGFQIVFCNFPVEGQQEGSTIGGGGILVLVWQIITFFCLISKDAQLPSVMNPYDICNWNCQDIFSAQSTENAYPSGCFETLLFPEQFL